MKDLSKYLFRASSIGKLMKGVKPNLTENQKKTLDALLEKKELGTLTDKQVSTLGDLITKRDSKPKLSQGAKTYLDEIIQEVVFGRSKQITSKYLDKGKQVEEYSISLYQDVYDTFLHKNEERFYNDWITGEPDVCTGKIYDFKSSWDFTTFPLNYEEIPNDIYKWQLIAYMELTGLKESELVYCLVDTPHNLIDDELRRLSWKLGCVSLDSMPQDLKIETVSNLIYTQKGLEDYCLQSMDVDIELFVDFNEIIPEHRIKVFNLDYDYKDVKSMYIQLELARDYLIDKQIQIADSIPIR